ncbi:MAG TPA: hypothetical protein VH165_08660 [Kofleriaceae bacterium]|jgi:hypothetical protein|nr:hypothetical protein [Kofleriaceae bacterium]
MWGLLVAGSGTALQADPAGGWLSPNGTAAGNVGISGGMRGGLTGRMSAQQVADVQARIHQMQEQTRIDARHVQHLQQIARQEKSVIKLNCVNDKLVQIKPQMNLADTAAAELAGGTDFNRVDAFDKVSMATENVHHLREEADQCIGEPIATGSESSNSFSGPWVPDDPNRGYSGGGLEPPIYASPFN